MMNTIKMVFLVLLFISCQLFASCHGVQEQKIAREESMAAADLNKELGLAAREGDVEKVTALIASRADVDSCIDGEANTLRSCGQHIAVTMRS
jgi:hypothetical protein